MRISVEKLRVGLLAGAALLVVATVGFLEYSHLRVRQALHDLPGKMGVDIRQQADAFTYSQTVQGRTIFTVHAAKAIEHASGVFTLHDVGVVLYGQNNNRADRIYGKQFEYDKNAGVIHAAGEVHIDLQAPEPADAAAKMDFAEGKDLKNVPKDDRLIHLKTSNLVFTQKLGTAATDQEIEFTYGAFTGHARGAEYDSHSGILTLQSTVTVNGIQSGKPISLTAAHAIMDRQNRRTTLTLPRYSAAGEAAQQTAEARHAVVYTRTDGSVECVEAEGSVKIADGRGGRMESSRAEVLLNERSQPQSARMLGDIFYSDETADRNAFGEAHRSALARFDAQGRLQHVTLDGAVALHDVDKRHGSNGSSDSTGKAPLLNSRQMNADTVELTLAADDGNRGRLWLREARAIGSARVESVAPAKPGGAATRSTMSGDALTARFVHDANGMHLSTVSGAGNTSLKRIDENGVEQTSSGHTLEAAFKAPQQGVEQIATAVQQGDVVMTRSAPGAETQRATAQKASYNGDTGQATLTGGVTLTGSGAVLWADHATMNRTTGDATADGNVKANYRQAAQSEIIHVLAQRAELKKSADQTLFYGAAGRPARMWQGGSQVEAPVLVLSQKQKSLVARDSGPGTALVVHTVLADSTNPEAPQKPATEVKTPGIARVISRELTYSDATREASFTGGVRIESVDGIIHGQQATAYLRSAQDKTGAAGFLGGSVERIVVAGKIRMEQPGRSATGEQIVYTAADGVFVLTGAPHAPPRVVDETQGTISGAELRFRAQDKSIVVSNENNYGNGTRVHTTTRVKQ